jgi:hypothetical protein
MSDNMNTSPFNWGQALKVEVGDLTNQGNGGATGATKAPASPIPAGRYAAFVQQIKHGTFKTGSYGVRCYSDLCH